ncbi:MAG TPA: biotin--[acetyl-CoA-carboxylase] ligase [Planctomycetota bacterium]|nr:biotin--[acetyl-CoA-carboxylase] ligase [Planctomycetota bacterium]
MLSDSELSVLLAERTRFRRLVHKDRCPSTQDLAAADPDTDDAVFWSDHQTLGRGRQQHRWYDEPGADLSVTVRLVGLQLPSPMALPVLVPLAVAQTVEPALACTAEIKWPNDVLVSGRKLAGVLIDAKSSRGSAADAKIDTFLVGIGINVNGTKLPAELRGCSTSCAAILGRWLDRGHLLLQLLEQLDRLLRRATTGELPRLEQEYRVRLGLLQRLVVLHARDRDYEGRLTEFTCERLVLDGTRVFPLGAVQELRAARP